jgi:hypothetical protein
LVESVNYWTIPDKTDITIFRLADSESNALAGTPVAIGDDGTGTHELAISRSTANIQNVLDEVDLYLERYPTLTGFFFDEMNNDDDAENLRYYQTIFDDVHSRALLVVQNPGTNFPELMIGVADTFMSFEGKSEVEPGDPPGSTPYNAFTPDPWQANPIHASTKFWHCIKNVSSTKFTAVHARWRTLGAGYLWIDEAANEYTAPPSYLEALEALEAG